MSEARYLVGDVFDRMAEIPGGSIDLIVTSPPFLALRSYLPADHPDKHLEIGSEATPAAFLSTLLALTREWRRLLAPHGSICVELGDTYAGDDRRNGETVDAKTPHRHVVGRPSSTRANVGNGWPLAKSLCLLPTLYPASLAYGRNLLDPDDTLKPWRIRNLIVWHRPNPPVGALGDKVRPSTSYITTACVSSSRWFDLDAERTPGPSMERDGEKRGSGYAAKSGNDGVSGFSRDCPTIVNHPSGAPPLDMWNIPTAPYHGSHYATFPPALPRKLINLMCPMQVCRTCGEPRRRIVEAEYEAHGVKNPNEKRLVTADSLTNPSAQGMEHGRATKHVTTLGWTDCGHDDYRRGVVLDPFAGSGTTLMAASELGRDSIGIDLDERNLELARQRCGMFLTEDEIPA